MVTAQVVARVPGSTQNDTLTVDVDFASAEIEVHALIRRAVEEQVRLLTVQQRLTVLAAQQRLERQYGDLPAARPTPSIDVEQEVERALTACREGRCIIVLDGTPITDLAGTVALRPQSQVQFLRLIPLQGG